jgi:predicted nucleotide-binding protein
VVNSALGDSASSPASPARAAASSDKVFVVYGHDPSARTELEAMLRRWGLDPIILDQLPSEGATLIEKLEKYYPNVSFAVVLANPDDEAFPKGKPDEKKYRARQNVVLELGLVLAHLGRSRVAILLKDQDVMERPSDIHGLIYIPFKTDLAKEAACYLLRKWLHKAFRLT